MRGVSDYLKREFLDARPGQRNFWLTIWLKRSRQTAPLTQNVSRAFGFVAYGNQCTLSP